MMRLSISVIVLIGLVGFVHSNSLAMLRSDIADSPTISIVGGTQAAGGEFPFMAVLRLSTYLCGGTLIDHDKILTAAHCVNGFSARDVPTFKVHVNTLSVNGGGIGSVTSGVKKFIMHENYNSRTNDNDVAILFLNTTITTVPYVSLPIDPNPATTTSPPSTSTTQATTKRTRRTTVKSKLRTTAKTAEAKAFSTYANENAVIAGWGTISAGGSISSVLLKANVTVQDNSICSSQYGSTFIAANMLCASAPGKDTCQGDSGGPILVNGVQIGITSFGIGCASPSHAGVYARVSTYVDWIATIQANNP